MNPNLKLLSPPLGVYVYAQAWNLPGRLRGAVVHAAALEPLQIATAYLRARHPSLQLGVLDSARTPTLQAALFLSTIEEQSEFSIRTKPAFPIRKGAPAMLAKNPATDPLAEHVTGVGIDIVLLNPRTGKPFDDDLLRYDDWVGGMMEPGAFIAPSIQEPDEHWRRRYSAMAFREILVREACIHARLLPSIHEFCQFHLPESQYAHFDAIDLVDFMIGREPVSLRDDLLDRCARGAH